MEIVDSLAHGHILHQTDFDFKALDCGSEWKGLYASQKDCERSKMWTDEQFADYVKDLVGEDGIAAQVDRSALPERGEKPEVVLARVKEHMPAWGQVTLLDVSITRLSGLSNACYKVKLAADVQIADSDTPRKVLYRKFENEIVDNKIEEIIFRSMSEKRMGPRFIFQDSEYRIEEFIEGRPLSVWELRNPTISKLFVKAIYEMHEKSGVREAISAVAPLDPNYLGVDIAIDEWAPTAVERIAEIKTKLDKRDPGHAYILDSLHALEDAYLKDGY